MVDGIQKSELIFSPPQIEVLNLLEEKENDHITEIFYGGSAGGGKTFLLCHWQIARRLHYPGTRGFIGRQSLKNLKLTTFKTFCDVWEQYYINNDKRIEWSLNGLTNTIHFTNGSEIVLMDLGYYPSDAEWHRLGSLEISDAVIDELPEVRKEAFEILQSRIRYKLDKVGGVPKCLTTGNPSNNWVKQRFIKDDQGLPVKLKIHQSVIRATVHDNPNEEFKRTYINALKKLNPVTRSRLLDGNWDVQLNDNPFFYAFAKQKHYRPEKYEIDPAYQLVISFDFNKSPCTAIVSQHRVHDLTWNVIGSHYASPDNRSALENLCAMINRTYLSKVNRFNIVVTGDATGKRGDADRNATSNRYTSIIRYLGISKNQVKVERSNLKHVLSRDLCNDVLHLLPRGSFVFWAGTERLIDNIEASFPDNRGSLEKAKADLGLHDVDCFRYLMKYYFAWNMNGTKFTQYRKNLDQYILRINANESRKEMVAMSKGIK